MGWDWISPGGVKYRAPYSANNFSMLHPLWSIIVDHHSCSSCSSNWSSVCSMCALSKLHGRQQQQFIAPTTMPLCPDAMPDCPLALRNFDRRNALRETPGQSFSTMCPPGVILAWGHNAICHRCHVHSCALSSLFEWFVEWSHKLQKKEHFKD